MSWEYFDFEDFIVIAVIIIIFFGLGFLFRSCIDKDEVQIVEVEKDCDCDDKNINPTSPEDEVEIASGKIVKLELYLDDDNICGTIKIELSNSDLDEAWSCPWLVDNDQSPQLGDTVRLYTIGKDYHVEIIDNTRKNPNPPNRGAQ